MHNAIYDILKIPPELEVPLLFPLYTKRNKSKVNGISLRKYNRRGILLISYWEDLLLGRLERNIIKKQ